MAHAARRYLIEGRVQGVGFRWFILREARALGLAGWVRNLADGRVEAYATGDARVLSQFAARLELGPARADVRAVETEEAAIEAGDSFEIR